MLRSDHSVRQPLKSIDMQPVKRLPENIQSAFARMFASSLLLPSSMTKSFLAIGLAVAFAACVFSGSVNAQAPQLRLGNPQVLSSLGSPLWVRIPIDVAESGADVNAARFSIGARPLNAPVPFVERAEIGLERQGSKYSLVIRSRTTIDEPAIGIVLREELPNGVRSRQFFLLLDPAPASTAVITDQSREPVGSEASTVLVPPIQPTQVPAIVASPPIYVAQPTTPTATPVASKRTARRTVQSRRNAKPYKNLIRRLGQRSALRYERR